jgi:hypothetical protein
MGSKSRTPARVEAISPHCCNICNRPIPRLLRRLQLVQVWFCIPTARETAAASAVIHKWKQMAYGVAAFVDRARSLDDIRELSPHVLAIAQDEYPGYARATNATIKLALENDKHARWFVIGGDDVHPDPKKPADVIAAECEKYFTKLHGAPTLGVMQPTGDRWGETPNRGAYIDRICGSAWLGREFCERVYGGNGPLFPEYYHMFVDEELQGVATALGLLWQRPDLTQLHEHWTKRIEPDPETGRRVPPEHLSFVTTQGHWQQSKALHARRRMLGYPGHELARKVTV